MKRVTGLGGVFFKCNDPATMKTWYRTHLGVESDERGAMFAWRDEDNPQKTCYTVWEPFPGATSYFRPSDKPFMFNYRVENLTDLLSILREEGVQVVGEVEEYEYGRFGWVMDPEGNKIELWEPVDEKLIPQ